MRCSIRERVPCAQFSLWERRTIASFVKRLCGGEDAQMARAAGERGIINGAHWLLSLLSAVWPWPFASLQQARGDRGGHEGIEEGTGHKHGQGRRARREERTGGSKASSQSKKPEAQCQRTQFGIDLMRIYLAIAFQQLKVFGGRCSCLHRDRLFVCTEICIQSLPSSKSSGDPPPSPGAENKASHATRAATACD